MKMKFRLFLFLLLTGVCLGQTKLERVDLLEVRDLMHQMDALKLQISLAELKIKELDSTLQEKVKDLYVKYKINKDDTLNLETGEVVPKGSKNEK